MTSRSLSSNARAAALALATPEAFIQLVTLTYPPTGEVFRVCMNTEPIVSRGQTFAPYGFRLTYPAESGEEVGQAGFEIDNTDLLLVDLLRAATEPVHVKLELVLASNPDAVELTLEDLVMREVNWNASTISGTLALDDVLNQRFPKDSYDPLQYAGLY